MTDDLTQFLRARLDEDDANIRDCIESGESNVSPRDLLDVAAWRVLLKEHDRLMYDVMPDDLSGVWAMEAVMRSKAAVYAAHPDYRPEWRP